MLRKVLGYLRDDILIPNDWFPHLGGAHSKAGRAEDNKNLKNS